MDCATDVEVLMSEKLGFKDIMFTSNDTQAKEFVYAQKVRATINLDAYEHIEFLKNVAGIPETVCLRYDPGGVSHWGQILWTTQKSLSLG